MARVAKDLSGMKFGKLTAISLTRKDNGRVAWNCICDCGNKSIVYPDYLKTGKTKTCGHCSNNEFYIEGNIVYGKTNKGEMFFFDLEDFERVNKHSWYMNNGGYFYTTINKKKVALHRFVLSVNSEDSVIDHERGNKRDNRKNSLRICNMAQNSKNHKKVKNNSSGFNGVSFNKKINKWIARICVDAKQLHLGCFEDIKDAIKARAKADLIYFKEFRYKGDDEEINRILKQVVLEDNECLA